MLFENQKFKLQKQESYFKEHIGVDDPTLSDYEFLSSSPMWEKEFRHNKAEMEYISSYIEAAKIIVNVNKIQNPQIKFIVKSYSIGLPAIFLCRQAIELSIKYAIIRKKGQYKPIHNLDNLWKIFEELVDKDKITLDEKNLLNDMKGFVDLINIFDNENGTKLRYPEGKDGTLNQKKLIFVNLQQITETTELFVKQMELIKEVF